MNITKIIVNQVISRRTFVRKICMAFAGLLALRYFSACKKNSKESSDSPPNSTFSPPPLTSDSSSPIAQTINVGTGVVVPAKFLGMHLHYYPHSSSGSPSSAPTFDYGTWRSHDYYGAGSGNSGAFKWFNLNPTQQSTINLIYNSAPTIWSELDTIIQSQYSLGRDIFFTIHGTPAWAARTDMVFSSGQLAPSSPPLNQSSLSLFVEALLTRYNTTNILPQATPIKYLEIWNEPEVRKNSECTFSGSTLTWGYSESSGVSTNLPIANTDSVFFTTTGVLPTGITANTQYFVVNTSGNNFSVSASNNGTAINLSAGSGTLYCHALLKSFFWGSSAEMALMAKTVYQKAKSIDNSVIVVSPGFTGGITYVDNEVTAFLNASDGSGQFGKNWIDCISIHPYDTTIDATTAIPQLPATLTQVRLLVTNTGLSSDFPILIGEQGWISPRSDTYFLNTSESEQAKKIIRHALVSASYGMQKHIFYAYDDNYLGSPYVSQSSVKQSMLDWFQKNICGKEIATCTILNSGAVTITLRDGNTFTV